jgi:hypothetical protein
MNIKQIRLVLIILGLSFYSAYAAEDDSNWKRENPDWNMTSEVFSNSPYWLMPTNVPYELYPLLNGKWVWTTNMQVTWFGDTEQRGVDDVKLRQVEQQLRQRMDETDPPGIAHVPGYTGRGWNEKHIWNTNMVQNWGWGIWAEDTNTGWRVNLRFYRTNTPNMEMTIHVGSVVTNSGAGLSRSPDGKYAKLELFDSNGTAVTTRNGAAMKLFEEENAVDPSSEKEHVNKQQPSVDDASVEGNHPNTISDLKYSRWENGSFLHFAGFVRNGPPCWIGYIKFNDIFDIKAEGDYTLTVQPVLYRMHNDGGTFQGYLDRVDLPSITTKVHLVPNVK